MAPSSPSACLLQTTHLRTFLIVSLLVFVPPIHALKPTIRPRDRQLSRPILNSLHSAVDLLPTFVGSVSSNDTVEWTGTCFYKTSAWMEFNNKSGSEFGGGTLHIKVSNAHSWTCTDLYVFATPYQVKWDYYFLSREHTIQFNAWEEKAEFEYVINEGVSVFLMHAGMRGTLEALWDVFPLFTNTGWGENANLGFLKKHMGASFQTRPQPWVTNISVDDIHSGDFLAISKIRGQWGGFETLEKWVTGSYAGHSAVCLRDSEGKLWVGESGVRNEKGENVVVISLWDKWWDNALTQDDFNSHIALLPLHPHLRSKFNETAAWEYARSMEGKRFGFHNMIFSWIDTPDENYPPPLDAHVVAAVMTVWNQMWPSDAANLWNEALNKRLGTQNLSLPEILIETETRGSSFAELLTIPEQDDWVYTDGKSTSCVSFILEMYKEAGLFGPIASSIQGTEFTNDIRKNPAFRSQFHEMCAKVGVDPLASNKGFWAELLGIGDFYYELGVQIVDICLATRVHNGGFIDLQELCNLLCQRCKSAHGAVSEDDCVCAISKLKVLGSGFEVISVGRRKLVRSVPTELNKDHNAILELAQAQGFVTVEEVERQLSWPSGRATDALETLLDEGLAMIDDGHRDGKRRYWFRASSLSAVGADILKI